MKGVFYTVVRFLLWLPVRIFLRVRVHGRKNEPKRGEGPYLVCGNHQTVLDAVFVCFAMHRQQPHFMGKAELFRVPFLGFLVKKLGAYPVTRSGNDVGAVKHTVKLIKSGRSVAMFPQGTRCPGKPLRECRVKSGVGLIAAHTGVQILPVHIGMKENRWKFYRRVDVTIGKPIPFQHFGYDKEKPGEYARISAEVYEEICRLGEAAGK